MLVYVRFVEAVCDSAGGRHLKVTPPALKQQTPATMSINPMNTYMIYLVDVACESPSTQDPPSQESNITDPAAFIADFLHHLATTDTPITRTGTERAADILFTHPDVTAFFRDRDHVAALRGRIFTTILPVASRLFCDHWEYIIRPILDEHAAVAVLTHP